MIFRLVYKKYKQDLQKILSDDLATNEFFVLRFLNQHGPQKITNIAQEFNVTNSHITALIDTLEKKEYLIRERSVTDRRIVQVDVTNEGREKLKTLEERRWVYIQDKFSTLNNEDLSQLIMLLKKLQ